MKILISFARYLYDFILGIHPRNTIFSYNFHNVYHINKFFQNFKSSIKINHAAIADIGAGKSPYYYIFSDIADKYTAVDSAESLPVNEQRKIEQKIGSAENLPLENNFFDIVLCNQVIEHVWHSEKVVNEAFRVLKAGGWFVGSVPHISPVHLEPYDFKRFTDYGLRKLLEESNFTEIIIQGNTGVFSSAAFIVAMDLMLSKIKAGSPQKFSPIKAMFLSPLVGMMNLTGLLLDKIFGSKYRSPANLCWVARKY